MSLSEYSVIKREFNGNRSVPSNFITDIEYSVKTSDVIKSFDCISVNIGIVYQEEFHELEGVVKVEHCCKGRLESCSWSGIQCHTLEPPL